MSMEMKKALLASVLAVGAFSFAGSAQAECTTDTDAQWECLQVGGTDVTGSGEQGPFTFAGTSTLSYGGFINATCGLELTGYVDVDTANNRTYIRVTNGDITGSGTCANLNLSGFDWNAYDPDDGNAGIDGASSDDIYPAASGNAALGDIGNISVSHSFFGTLCSGTLDDVTFQNNEPSGSLSDPSFFVFSGSIGACTVNGQLDSTGTDVNAW